MTYLMNSDDKMEVVYIVATKRIRAGFEVATKYGLKGDDSEKYEYVICLCRTPNCSKIIGEFNK